MKVFDTDAEYFLGSADRPDMTIDEAQLKASTIGEDQDEDPKASPEEISHVYALTGMDPAMWDEEQE